MLVPLIAVVLFLALYPQLALHRSEGSVKSAVAPVSACVRAARLRAARPSTRLDRRRRLASCPPPCIPGARP